LRVEAEDGTREMRWRAALPHEFVTADSGEMLMESRRCSEGGAGRADGMMLLLVVWVRLAGRECKTRERRCRTAATGLGWAGVD
jgi:hypothetical protein